MNKIAAVVVTYNRLKMLKQCVDALLQQTCECDILLVNNASTDQTEQWALDVIKTHPKICYYNTNANIGGAGGFNYGIKKAVEAGYEYIWIMDDDCIPKENALEELMAADAALKDREYGFISSAVLWKDGKECKMNRQKVRKNYYENVELLEKGLLAVEQATFVSLLFPKKTIEKAGLPIKEFFIWGDDVEYTRRITVRMGLESYLAGKSQVVHAMTENNGSNIAIDVPQRIDRYRYAFRNEGYLYRKEGFKGFCYYIAKCGLNLLRIITKAKNKRIKRCWVLVSSMVRGLFFHPKVEYVKQRGE